MDTRVSMSGGAAAGCSDAAEQRGCTQVSVCVPSHGRFVNTRVSMSGGAAGGCADAAQQEGGVQVWMCRRQTLCAMTMKLLVVVQMQPSKRGP